MEQSFDFGTTLMTFSAFSWNDCRDPFATNCAVKFLDAFSRPVNAHGMLPPETLVIQD
jgi:hypothetical protein